MKLRERLYNLLHANKLARQAQELAAKNAQLRQQTAQLQAERNFREEQLEATKTALQTAYTIKVAANSAEELYEQLQSLDPGKKHLLKELDKAYEDYGCLRCLPDSGSDHFYHIACVNALVNMKVVSADCRIHLLPEDLERRVLRQLDANKLPPEMTVGKIDYLAPDGSVAETVQYKDSCRFLNDVFRENQYGAPMDITIFMDPEHGRIKNAWVALLDPPPQGFSISYLEEAPESSLAPAQEHALEQTVEMELTY